MSKYIAIQGMTVEAEGIDGLEGAGGSVIIAETGPASTKVKINGTGIALNNHAFTVTLNAPPSFTPPTLSQTHNLIATAVKTKSNGMSVIRVDDVSTPIPWAFTPPSGPPPISGTLNLKVTDAGQNKVKGD